MRCSGRCSMRPILRPIPVQHSPARHFGGACLPAAAGTWCYRPRRAAAWFADRWTRGSGTAGSSGLPGYRAAGRSSGGSPPGCCSRSGKGLIQTGVKDQLMATDRAEQACISRPGVGWPAVGKGRRTHRLVTRSFWHCVWLQCVLRKLPLVQGQSPGSQSARVQVSPSLQTPSGGGATGPVSRAEAADTEGIILRWQ